MVVYKSVYVLSRFEKPLMPCSPRKARLLLKQNKAKVIRRTPFTIQLLYGSGSAVQPVVLGVDSGYEHVGLSAVSEKAELFTAEVLLRKDVSKLLTERRMYRHNRRSRKTRYRKARFLNRVRTKHKGWLAPSIQHKLDSHLRIIQKAATILPVSKIIIETASFDIQKIKNLEIAGRDYQAGEQLGFANVRAYVLHRDNYLCQNCKDKSKNIKLNVHHIVARSQAGTDRPDNLITLCEKCHKLYHQGKIKLNIKTRKTFKAETFMSTVRKRLVLQLQQLYGDVEETFGYITKSRREDLGLMKSHINDAFCITEGNVQIRSGFQYLIKQVRKQNRKLFKGVRSHIRNTAPRFLFGFQRYDKVSFQDKEYFILGRRNRGYFKLGTLNSILKLEPSYKRLKLLESFTTFLIRREAVSSSA
jgi:hypothetical protein